MTPILRAAVLLSAPVAIDTAPPFVAPTTIAELETRIRKVLDSTHTPGVGLAIVRHDSVIYTGGLGNARFLCALPLFAFGLAAVLQAIHTAARRRPLRLATAAGALLVAWNLLLMAQYRHELVPRDDTVAWPVLVQNGAGLVTSALGAPSAWPANWLFAGQEGLPAARYDLLAGQDVLASGPTRLLLGDAEASAAILGEGWSVRHPCGTAVCREIEGEHARLFLPVVDPRTAEWRVRASGSGILRVGLNGTALAEATLTAAMADVGAIVDRGRVRRGVNVLLLETVGGRASVEAVSIAPRGGAR